MNNLRTIPEYDLSRSPATGASPGLLGRFGARTTDVPGRDRGRHHGRNSGLVLAALQPTIVAGPADRSAALDTAAGFAMVWWTSKPVAGFDIQQRCESGWSNWGANRENERPELPNDVRIRTAYGPFGASWQATSWTRLALRDRCDGSARTGR